MIRKPILNAMLALLGRAVPAKERKAAKNLVRRVLRPRAEPVRHFTRENARRLRQIAAGTLSPNATSGVDY